MDKLKTFIFNKKIYVRKMRRDAIPVDNIAWFILCSNDRMPVMLDSRDS
jgi:hypothetical protein